MRFSGILLLSICLLSIILSGRKIGSSSSQVDAIPNFSASLLNVVTPIDKVTGTNVVYSIANILPSDLCVLDNGDIVFREGKFLKKYSASSKTVSYYLGKGTLNQDGTKTTLIYTEVLFLKRVEVDGKEKCLYLDYTKKVREISGNDTVSTVVALSTGSTDNFGDDEFGNLFMHSIGRIALINITSGHSITVAGVVNGGSTAAMPADGVSAFSLIRPPSSMISRNGTLYMTINNSIMKVENGILYRLAAEKGSWSSCTFNITYSGRAFDACVISPKLITIIDNEIYFADKSNSVVRKINRDGFIELLLGNGAETIDLSRTNQTLQSLGPNAFTGISIIPKNNYLQFHIALKNNIITVGKDSILQTIAGYIKEDLTLSVFSSGFPFNPILKPMKTFKNGDFIIIGQDKRTLFRMSKKKGLLKPILVFNSDIISYIVDKSTRLDLYLVNEVKVSDSLVTNHIYKFNIKSKSVQLIAGNYSASGFKYDGQSALDISITNFLNMQYFNHSLYFSYGADQYRIFQLNLTSFTITKVFGVGYQEGISLSGLESDATSVTFNSLYQITSHPKTGNLFLRTNNVISFLDEQNKVQPYIGLGNDNANDVPNILEGNQMPTSLTDQIAFHPTTQNLYFVYSSGFSYSYILEYVNATSLRIVMTVPNTLNKFVIRKSTGFIYYLMPDSIVEFKPTNDTHTTIFSSKTTNPYIYFCLLRDDTLVFSQFLSTDLSIFNLTSNKLSTKQLNRTKSGITENCQVTNLDCTSSEVYASCISLRTGYIYIAKFQLNDTEVTPLTNGLPFSPRDFHLHQNGTLYSLFTLVQ